MASTFRILIAYYSYTSRVETLARSLAACLSESHEVTVAPIRPLRERSYWNWLARSFVPGSTVAIEPFGFHVQDFDRVCLGFPKWTLSCPPFSRFLNSLPQQSSSVLGLFMAYGGFDEDRFFRSMTRRAQAKGRVVARLAVKRTRIESPACEAVVRAFCDAVVASDRAFYFKL